MSILDPLIMLTVPYKKWMNSMHYSLLFERGLISKEEYGKIIVARFFRNGCYPDNITYKIPELTPEIARDLGMSYLEIPHKMTLPNFRKKTYTFKGYPDIELPMNLPDFISIQELRKQYKHPLKLYSILDFLEYLAYKKGYRGKNKVRLVTLDLALDDPRLSFLVSEAYYQNPPAPTITKQVMKLFKKKLGIDLSKETARLLYTRYTTGTWGGVFSSVLLDSELAKAFALAVEGRLVKAIEKFEQATCYELVQRLPALELVEAGVSKRPRYSVKMTPSFTFIKQGAYLKIVFDIDYYTIPSNGLKHTKLIRIPHKEFARALYLYHTLPIKKEEGKIET